MKKYCLMFLFFGIFNSAYSYFQPYRNIETPTAGILPHGGYIFNIRQDPYGRVTGNFGVGFAGRVYFSLGYGGGNIIGDGDPIWNPYPFVEARVRILDESFVIPAIAIGYSSYGYGEYFSGEGRFKRKQNNFYIVGSKVVDVFNYGAVHFGTEFLPNPDSGESKVDFFAGAQVAVNNYVEILADFRLGISDKVKDSYFGEGKGYLNAGVKMWALPSLSIAFYFSNILENGEEGSTHSKISRSMEISYEGLF